MTVVLRLPRPIGRGAPLLLGVAGDVEELAIPEPSLSRDLVGFNAVSRRLGLSGVVDAAGAGADGAGATDGLRSSSSSSSSSPDDPAELYSSPSALGA